MTPFGNEISIGAGWIDPATGAPYVIPATGLTELVPMGIFPMTTVDETDSGTDVAIAITGYDRSWVISQRAFLLPYAVSAGTAPEVAIQAILTQQAPEYPALNMAPTGFSLPDMSFNQGSDPWAACTTIADAAGCELCFDVNGIPTGFPIPDPTTLPVVWNFRADGTGDSAMTTLQRTRTRSGVSNDFTVTGTGSANAPGGSGSTTGPVTAQAIDSDPASVTYVDGVFGDSDIHDLVLHHDYGCRSGISG